MFIGACGMAKDAIDSLAPNFEGEGTAACADDELMVVPKLEIDRGLKLALTTW